MSSQQRTVTASTQARSKIYITSANPLLLNDYPHTPRKAMSKQPLQPIDYMTKIRDQSGMYDPNITRKP